MPDVSVIVPCYNEQGTIRLLLSALVQQNYPLHDMEVIIADGLSTDGTREEIRAFASENPELCIRVIDNEKRNIPAALNYAIDNAKGKYIIRLDAHSMPDKQYIRESVRALEMHLGDNIGGVWEIRPGAKNLWARSIAIAASHPLGVGDARYRYTDRAGYVDTVPFGAFRRDLIDRIGPFNETLLTNEDYEFNTRIRQEGGKVWLDPAIRSIYFARPSISALARQYWRYGYWKAKMLKRYPGSVRWRQVLPPLYVLSLISLGILSIFFTPARWILGFLLFTYLLFLMITGFFASLKNRDIAVLLGFPVAVATMHLVWGSGFLWSSVEQLAFGKDDE